MWRGLFAFASTLCLAGCASLLGDFSDGADLSDAAAVVEDGGASLDVRADAIGDRTTGGPAIPLEAGAVTARDAASDRNPPSIALPSPPLLDGSVPDAAFATVAADATSDAPPADASGVLEPTTSDAEASEAGADNAVDSGNATACIPGGACSPGDCQNGSWACVNGIRACQETSAFDAGTPCGTGGSRVCNAGQCVACNAGGDCSAAAVPCIKKAYDCASGTAVCKVTGNASDGTPCGAGLYCSAGVCGACLVGAACLPAANACHVGKVTACTGATLSCADQGTAATAGTACSATGGASGVCDGSGACIACSPGAQCNPGGNVCQVGVESCSAGYACVGATNVH